MTNQENSFVGFEYMEVPAKRSMESLYVDSYRNFAGNMRGAPTGEQRPGDGEVQAEPEDPQQGGVVPAPEAV